MDDTEDDDKMLRIDSFHKMKKNPLVSSDHLRYLCIFVLFALVSLVLFVLNITPLRGQPMGGPHLSIYTHDPARGRNGTQTALTLATTANWITKDYILSQLDRYQPPKLFTDNENDFHQQFNYYKPPNFGKGLDVKPPKESDFLKDMKNPCWRDGPSSHCLPYFYLLGFPKCGTTDLWERIARHPQVAIRGKEYQWWTRGRYESHPLHTYTKKFLENLKRHAADVISKRDASKLSKQRGQQKQRVKERRPTLNYNDTMSLAKKFITGDGSPSYLWDVSHYSKAVMSGRLNSIKPIVEPDLSIAHLIKAYSPKSRFIAIMRDPVDVMYSHYLYRDSGRTKSPANFHQRITQIVAMYDDCFRRHSIRACAYDPNIVAESDRQGVRLYHVLYVIYLSDWFKIIPREQFLLLRTEDYEQDVYGHLKKVFEFLDIEMPSEETLQAMAGRKNANVQKKVPSWNETRELLENFVRPFNDALSELLGEECFAWGKS